MAINLVTTFKPYVDEQFTTESKKSLLTNTDFDWIGAHSIKVYKVSTSEMNDYNRNPFETGTLNSGGKGAFADPSGSRYGVIKDLNATTEEFTLRKDRSFTFAIDKLDMDETAQQLEAASALARQDREVVIPEVDTYVYWVMCEGAGHRPAELTLTSTNIYTEIVGANNVLDNSEVPETGRCLMVTPDTYVLMKKCKDIVMETDIGNDLRLKGVVGMIDGLLVIKIPSMRLPKQFGFMIAHPCATVAPTKLEDYKVHQDPPGISGSLVEGRICYDAFVLYNKKCAIYYQEQPAS